MAGLEPLMGDYPEVQPSGGPGCANPLIMNIRWPELLLSTDRDAEIQWFSTDGPNFTTRSGIAIGSTSEEVEASLPVHRVPGDEMYPPKYDVISGPDEGLHIDIGYDETVTGFYAGGDGLDCVGAHESG